jgi:DNA end-binding protein Ku
MGEMGTTAILAGSSRGMLVFMRAIWKGAVSFGLVNVPVRLYSATENHDVQFRQVHREDGGRIRYRRVCSIDGEEVAYDDIAKGYETEDGDMVVLTDEDFADLPSKTSKEISVEKFVPADQIDPMFLDKSYYLEPDKSATKPYVLLREALESENRMAIVTVSIRTRMTMAVLRVRDGVIVMQTMLWPDEIRSPDFASVDSETEATKQEMAMAKLLIDQLAGDYEPDEYEDDYAKAVEALVKAKVEGGEVAVAAEPAEESGEVVDLLAALARSVERAKAARGEAPDEDETEEPREKPAKRTAARRSAAKNAPAKEPSAKKGATKRTPTGKTPTEKSATKKSTAKKSTTKKAVDRKAS